MSASDRAPVMTGSPPGHPAERYDVVVLGGAFAGGSAALLLRRICPELRVLVVERRPAFDAKVGEATTKVSALFLTRRLALWEHLEREHLPKEGLRYWFTNGAVRSHAEASETGGVLRTAVPSFPLRRDVLDEHLLALADAHAAGSRASIGREPQFDLVATDPHARILLFIGSVHEVRHAEACFQSWRPGSG